jgi:hypothetical protein
MELARNLDQNQSEPRIGGNAVGTVYVRELH